MLLRQGCYIFLCLSPTHPSARLKHLALLRGAKEECKKTQTRWHLVWIKGQQRSTIINPRQGDLKSLVCVGAWFSLFPFFQRKGSSIPLSFPKVSPCPPGGQWKDVGRICEGLQIAVLQLNLILLAFSLFPFACSIIRRGSRQFGKAGGVWERFQIVCRQCRLRTYGTFQHNRQWFDTKPLSD